MRLYISGGIANVPDYLQRFRKADQTLRDFGYRTINPTDVNACSLDLSLPRLKTLTAPCWDKPHPKTTWEPPHITTVLDTPLHTWECYMKHDIEELVHCDGVAVLDGWQTSAGATIEVDIADQLGIPIKTIQEWIDEYRDHRRK